MSDYTQLSQWLDGDAAALPKTLAALRGGVERGLHPGAQAYVSKDGKTVGDFAVGAARPGVPMRRDAVVLWMSAGKPAAAVAVAQLWERGRLDLDDPVARHVREFGTRGKEAITVRHLLTHTGGFRGLPGPWEEQPWEKVIAAVCDARLEPGWVPGRKAGYHLATSWYVLGELVRRLDERGRPFERYVRDEVFGPVGMADSWVGMPAERFRQYGERTGWMFDTTDPASPKGPSTLDTEEGVTSCRPGSNARGPARELGLFYEMLMGKGQRADAAGRRVLSSPVAEALAAPLRVGMYDHTFRHVMDWGLGVIVNSARCGTETVPYGFGPYASPRTFGHGGSQCCSGFCDPENGIVVAVACNGRPGEAAHDQRMRSVHAAVYEDLGLAATF